MKVYHGGSLLNLYTLALGLLIFISIAVPSNYVFNIPVKFSAMALVTALLVIVSTALKLNKKSILYLALSIIFCITWTLIGLHNGYPTSSVFGEAGSLLAMILTLFLSFALTNNENKQEIASIIIRYAFYGSFAFLTIKTLIFVALFYIPGFLIIASEALNYTPVGMAIVTGGSRLSYINNDFATLCIIAIAFYMRTDLKLNNRLVWVVTFALLAISLYAAYSRALFVLALLFIALYLFFYSKSKILVRLIFLVSATLLVGFSVQSFYSEISTIIEQRFNNQVYSDSQRAVMMDKILTYWAENIFWGWGLGAYIPYYIRSSIAAYSYEVQLLSIFMKTGFFGILVIIALSTSFIRKCLNRSKPASFFALVYFILLASSMTNQYLLTAPTSVLIAVLWHSLALCTKKNSQKLASTGSSSLSRIRINNSYLG